MPVIAVLPEQTDISCEEAIGLVEAGPDGIALPLGRIGQTAAGFSGRSDSEALSPVRQTRTKCFLMVSLKHSYHWSQASILAYTVPHVLFMSLHQALKPWSS